jgi:hypothetical protein
MIMNPCSAVSTDGDKLCHCGSCGCRIDEGHDVAAKMFHLALCAKHNVLKKKMEKLIEQKIGDHLDAIAEVAVEAVIDRMERMAAKKHASHQYEEKMMDTLRND